MPRANKVLFVQGVGAGTHDDCIQLVQSLIGALGPDYDVICPLLPEEAYPNFVNWSQAITQQIEQLGSGMIVGHSFGGAVLIHTLAKHGRLLNNITGIVLIAAPFLGEGGWSSDDVTLVEGWANPLATFPIHLFQGDDDKIVAADHADLYAAAIPNAHLHPMPGRDHMLNNDLAEVAATIRNLTT